MKSTAKLMLALVLGIIALTGCGNKNPNDNVDNQTENKVIGNYSREIFSNNTFEYKTYYDSATFKFYEDSTFEIIYDGGFTYKGTYEVYNGLNISVKANEIKNDTSIPYSEQLYIDIINVSNAMMSDQEYLLNTYLLYITANKQIINGESKDVNLLQPFLVRYDENLKEGTIVNIMGQTQGTLTLK